MLNGLGEYWENHQSLSYVAKIIRIELTSFFGIEKSSKTCCQERTYSRYGTVNIFRCTILPIDLDGVSYDRSLLLSTGLKKCYTFTRCRWLMHLACGSLYPPQLNVSNQDFVFTSKFWSLRYHFQAWLRLLLAHLLWEHLGIAWLHAEKTFSTDLWHSKSLSTGPMGLHI